MTPCPNRRGRACNARLRSLKGLLELVIETAIMSRGTALYKTYIILSLYCQVTMPNWCGVAVGVRPRQLPRHPHQNK